MKVLLSGNEALARGAYEANVKVATAYPGTPSTEILETMVKYEEIKSQWAPNEKVALEVAIGASMAGVRALVAMKHVGLNVAADPWMTLSYTGVGGGLVLVSADDPGMHSSQNEQDNRYYAKMAKVPILEPSDSQEAKDFVGLALQISEEFETPVLLRTTTRISHSKSLVELKDRQWTPLKKYEKDIEKWVMIPAHGRLRHLVVEARQKDLSEWIWKSRINHWEIKDRSIGIITSGVSYQYVKEAFPEASILKLSIIYPLCEKQIRLFAGEVERLYVVEELDPFLEEQIRALGIEVTGKEIIPETGELSTEILRKAFSPKEESLFKNRPKPLAKRPPVLCAGCPHRASIYGLKRLGLKVTGDIGCYTLGALPPLSGMDSTVCMGASIGMAEGFTLGNEEYEGNTVAVIGDSTFLHTGIQGLLDAVYNNVNITVVILDNRTTAMTGHQEHPGTGKTLRGEKTKAVNLSRLVEALGVEKVTVVDPMDQEKFKKAVEDSLAYEGPAVVISRRPCILKVKKYSEPYQVDSTKCDGCHSCIQVGCPAISVTGCHVAINQTTCVGCGLCAQVCPQQAIKKVGETSA
ncbi:MAG: indolepyruvate ferredoxin oxidoreductase subunit alpha [Firmicutes bacterium]|nr:indolepyruvate ferredoxin oxidoreductase subunit alpha [Bacillota bacterium]